MTNFQFKCEADDPNWHGEGTWPKYTINSLHEGSVQIFHFRDFKYSYDGNELTEYDVFGMGHPVKGKNFSITDDSPILVAAPKEEISETDGKRFDKYGAEIDKDGNYVDERDAEYKHEYRELPLNEDDPTSEELLDDIFDDIVPLSKKDMGKIMKEANSRLRGKADFKLVSEIVIIK